MLLQRPQAAFVSCFHKFMHESGGGRESDAVAFLTGSQSKRQSDVGFAGTRRTERNTIMALLDPITARQFKNQRFVERWLGGEVEGVQTFGLWKARDANAAFNVAPFPVDALQLTQAQEIARVIGAVLR